MARIFLNLLMAMGVIIVLVGAGLDYILPGASPGLNLPQLSLVASGFVLAIGAYRLRRLGIPLSLTSSIRKHGVKVLVIVLLTLLALEIVLTVFGMPIFYPAEFSRRPLVDVPWFTCDGHGCRYIYDATLSACERGQLQGRACIVNKQGYPDTQDFSAADVIEGGHRFLFLGDSFTRGWSADIGKSYVETVEKSLPEALVWNTAIAGTGTNQAVATFTQLGPILQPHMTILGFYLNDFYDNLYPLDNYHRVISEDGQVDWVRLYALDPGGNALRLPAIQAVVDYARAGKQPLPNEIERSVGNTRLGTLLLRLREKIIRMATPRARLNDPFPERGERRTRQLLGTLKRLVAAQDSAFLVVLIAYRTDMDWPVQRLATAIELMHELEIPYLDTTQIVQTPGDYAQIPNDHWNNSGHQKVGALLTECLDSFLASGHLSRCKHVILPTDTS